MKMSIFDVGSSLRLRQYYYMIVRHKVVFTAVVTVSILISMFVAISMPKIYRAETVLLVQDKDILKPLISGLVISPSVGARLRHIKEELLSWQRMTLLVEKLGLDKQVKTPLDYEKLIKSLRENISIRRRGDDIIAIGFDGVSPKKAQEIVQTYSDIIVDGSLTSQKIETSSAIEFISEQLATYREKLEASEERLRKFREVYMTTLPLAIRTNEQIVRLRLTLNQLMIDNTELHPRVIQTRQLIDQLESQRDSQMKQAQADGADIAMEDFGKLVSSLPRQEQHLAKLQRDYDVNARMYDNLLQRLETAKISETLENSDKGPKFKILEPARLPLKPVKPNKPLIALSGLFIGIGLGCVLVFLIDLSNTSIRDLQEASSLLELPIFGSISPINTEQAIIEHRLRREVSV